MAGCGVFQTRFWPQRCGFRPRCTTSGRFGTFSGPQVADSSIRLTALSRLMATAFMAIQPLCPAPH